MRQVHLEYINDDGTWSAESPEVPGYSALGDSREEVAELAREGLPFFLGEPVIVIDEDRFVAPAQASAWVSILVSLGSSPYVANAGGGIRTPFPKVRDLPEHEKVSA